LSLSSETDLGFRGKVLAVEATIPKNWFKAGESIPITLQLIPQGYKKVFTPKD
jgi:hypothetical protein